MSFNIQVSIADFHSIFSSIQEKYIRLEQEADQMLFETREFGLFEDEDKVSDPARYAQLREEVAELKELNKRLYAETDRQLKEGN